MNYTVSKDKNTYLFGNISIDLFELCVII